MSGFERLRDFITTGDGSDQEYVEGHSPQESRPGGGEVVNKGTVSKQEPDRKTSLPPKLARSVRNREGAMKPYDAGWLKELSENWVVQAYIDTMAQDAATAPWSLKPRDERTEVDADAIADAERKLEQLNPEKSFRDLREMAAKNTLKLGDGAWVKHYYPDGGLAEAVPVDSSRLYKIVDDHGMTEQYIEVSFSERAVSQRYDLEEIVWFEWSSREDHVYGMGAVEKGSDVIEVLEELGEKEKKDLKEGMPPGIVSVKEDEDTPMAVDSYEKVKSNWKLKEGERHRAIVSMGDWQFTPLDPGYQELQFMERNKLWIQSLGAVFKVNAPYAGFDFQEGNKAQNTAQTEAYKQRGFHVLLRQMEEAINRQLVWPDISEDLKFEFETVTSTEEKQSEAQYQDQLAAAAESWDNLGRDVALHDGRLEIEDGPVEAPDDQGPAGEGGNPFGLSGGAEAEAFSLEKDDPLADGHQRIPDGDLYCNDEGARFGKQELAEDAGCPRCGDSIVPADKDGGDGERTALTKQEVAKLDETLLEAHRTQIQPESLDDIEKRVWTESDAVPEYVRERIGDAIDGGAVFENIESVPDRTVERLKEILSDALTQPQGWSMDSVVDRMKGEWPGVPEDKLETVARTETASVLNEAREEGYEDLPGDDDPVFYWEGPDDTRTTEACEELKARTNPDFGGDPVEMERLVAYERDVTEEYFENLDFRRHAVHPNERHTFVRAASSGVDWD